MRLPCVALAALLAACKPGADEFFSGRPSQMAQVHNRILAGPPEAMLDLLRVPSRFPDAREPHIAEWQASVVAWWRNPAKHRVMQDAFKSLGRGEADALKTWLRTRPKNQPVRDLRTLQEIEAAVVAVAG